MRVRELRFPPFHLDLANDQLWRGQEQVSLRPKTLAVLRHLAERAGQLVTREELVVAVWGGTAGSELLPKGCVRELRDALDDRSESPRFIATVGRRGYRFVAPVALAVPEGGRPARGPVVGRQGELAALQRWLDRALAGERRLGFLAGEPGIGKTTLVDAFVEQLPAGALHVARGQCAEHFGAGEAYFPVLDALGRLCRQPGGDALVGLLARHAPTWIAQMPSLVDDAMLEMVQRRAQGATSARMLRELAEAIEALGAGRPIVLLLEDLQWSDPSTLDLLSYLARRREPARLLVIGTYRPADVIVSGHPVRALTQELRASGASEELSLTFLGRSDVVAYLGARFPGHAEAGELAERLYRTTDGNPLFLVSLVDDLVAHGLLVERDGRWCVDPAAVDVAGNVPESVRGLIDRQVDRLEPADQRVLATASVAGVEFTAAAVAAGLAAPLRDVDECLDRLAHRQAFVRVRQGGAGYAFSHTLHQRVLYARLAPAERSHLHGEFGEWLETLYGSHADEAAAELAEHFERARRLPAAAYYRTTAARNALGRHAHRESIMHLERALALLGEQSEVAERGVQQLDALVALGTVLMATQGHAIRQAERVYAQARELCWQLGAPRQLLAVLRGLQRVRLVRGELTEARSLAERYIQVAERLQDRAALPDAHLAVGETLVFEGALEQGLASLERGIGLWSFPVAASPNPVALQDPGVGCRFYAALARWLVGDVDQAVRHVEEMGRSAETLRHPYTLAYAAVRTAWLHHVRRDVEATGRAADVAFGHAVAHGFELVRAQAALLRGWALVASGDHAGGLALMREGQAVWESAEAVLVQPLHLALLAEGHGLAGQPEEALSLLADARAAVDRTGERWWEAELYRLTGEVALRGGRLAAEGERAFRRAIEIARGQGARSLELRAAVSLCRVRGRRGRPPDEALASAYAQFSEGLESPELREARALLAG